MRSLARTFYQYLSLHSLLIGVFPFFLPVYLWTRDYRLGEISIFISISGLAFCIALWCWDRIRCQINFTQLIALSLVLEVVLLLTVFLLDIDRWAGLLAVGFSYGIYNCFFWTTQRALFFERIDESNSGRQYGNLQMYVGLVLQIGILIGGLLLEKLGFAYVLGFSLISCIVGFYVLSKNPVQEMALHRVKPLSFSQIIRFRDSHASKPIFMVDGIYLFLESFFWVISLFLLAHESFLALGLTVMSLAVLFGIIFYLLKNTIDRLDTWHIYRLAVALYALSWLLRANVNEGQSLLVLFILLVVITFCTSFFRLAMNKRFYDLAKITLNHQYLVLKSYYSQIIIAVSFLVFGLLTLHSNESEKLLMPVYWAASIISLSFLLYGVSYAQEKRQAKMTLSSKI